jgi:Ca2+-binding RTX toxin-like protein
MPTVSVERLPVRLLGLGFLGFDHLQIVFRNGALTEQEHWFVIEGVRDADEAGVWLGVEGWDGGTTLSDANGGLIGEDLLRRIGTSAGRGAQDVADGGEAIALWGRLISHASDIAAQHFPYIPIALPNSALPTINSSSLIASLLHHAGVRLLDVLPSGLRFSPGISTLLGTSGDDTLEAAQGFTTLVGGGGDDVLTGSETTGTVDKLYGGAGNDTLRWSRGVNILHGGQPGLGYPEDGIDTVDYSGAGVIRIDALPAGVPHGQADFVVRHAGGRDYLFSIEEILWDAAHDRVTLGDGVGLAARSTGLEPVGVLPDARLDDMGNIDFPDLDALDTLPPDALHGFTDMHSLGLGAGG